MSQDFSSFPSKGTEAGIMDAANSPTVPPTLTPSNDSTAAARSTAGPTGTPSAHDTAASSSTAAPSTVAKEQAGHVAKEAGAAGAQVAGTAKEQAGKVAAEAKTQVKDLLGQAQGELSDQVGVQQKRVASGLHSIGDELGSMARNADGTGIATDLVQQLSTRAGDVASWLDNRDPGSLLSEARGYARRHPGTFIAIAAVAGVLAGRLTRSVTASAADKKDDVDTLRAARPSGAHLGTPSEPDPASPQVTLPPAAQVSDVGASSYTIQPHPADLDGVLADPYRGSESDPYRRSGDSVEDPDLNDRDRGGNPL